MLESGQYMTEQRFDIAFSTKEIRREAAGLTTASKTKLKRTSHVTSKDASDVYWIYPWVLKLDDVIHVTVDADWAGDPKTRCSHVGRSVSRSVRASLFDIGLLHRQQLSLSLAESDAKAITKGLH